MWGQRGILGVMAALTLCLVPVATAVGGTRPRAYYALPGGSSSCDRGPLRFCYVTRPRQFLFQGGLFASLNWHSWGGLTATASGRGAVDLCLPTCGAGDVVYGPVRVQLRDLRREHGREVYTCVITDGPKRAPVFRWGACGADRRRR